METVSRDQAALAFTRGDRMRKALNYAQLSADDMADYLGVSPATLSRWLNMKTPVNRAGLRLWAMRCGVRLEWLESGAGAPVAGHGGGGDEDSKSLPVWTSGLEQVA